MILNVKLANFLSFGEFARLEMISSSKIRLHKEHIYEENEKKVLKYASVFGPNAAGKSSFVKFFKLLISFLTLGITTNMKDFYFRLKEENKFEPSLFEIEILLDGEVYRYGFSIIFSKLMIVEEYLTVNINSDQIILFRRTEDEITYDESYFQDSIERLNYYIEDYNLDHAESFLSFLSKKKKYTHMPSLAKIQRVYDYLIENIIYINPMSVFELSHESLSDPNLCDHISRLLNSFDTGVKEVKGIKIPRLDFIEAVGSETVEKLDNDIFRDPSLKEIKLRRGCDVFIIRKNEENSIEYETLKFRHGNGKNENWLKFSEESDGTIRLFDFSPLLLTQTEDVVFVVDEIDRSLHTKTIREFLDRFIRANSNSNNQLIFTTHDTDLMDSELFRRDEMWLIERDPLGVSHLYPIDRFKERSDKSIRKGYLEGRYGALPVFSEMEDLDE